MPTLIYENRRTDTTPRSSELPAGRVFDDLQHKGLLAASIGSAAFGLWKGGLLGLFSVGVGASLMVQFLQRNEIIGEGRTLLNTNASESANAQDAVTDDRDTEELYER